MKIFDIHYIKNSKPAAGRIIIGDFKEKFSLEIYEWSPKDYQRSWLLALQEMVDGAKSVSLMTWAANPSSQIVRRAWILYRKDNTVYIQERLFIPEDKSFVMDKSGRVINHSPRRTKSVDGGPISEWTTNITAIKVYIKQYSKIAA